MKEQDEAPEPEIRPEAPAAPGGNFDSYSLEQLTGPASLGDVEALRQFFTRIWQIAFGVARSRYSLHRPDAEDVAQDVCCAAILARIVESSIRCAAWAFASAKYACIDRHRRLAVETAGLDRLAREHQDRVEPHPGEQSVESGTWDVQIAFLELPPELQTVVRLRFADGMSWHEIDALLFAGQDRSRYRVAQAIQTLSARLTRSRRRFPTRGR